MGKISLEAKKQYFDEVKEYKKAIEQIILRERNVLEVIKRDAGGAEYKKLTLADENLNLVSQFLLLNALSLTLLGVKNENFLNDARKACYRSIIYLEEVVTPMIDVPFSEYEPMLLKIDGLEDGKRYDLIRKLGFSIQAVQDGFGDNTKWRWSFVELEGRFAVVSKNMINLKTVLARMDPRIEGYETRVEHLLLVKKLLQHAADRYREKYELSTLRMDDIKRAISLLSALRRFHALLGESAEVEVVKKKIEIWTQKMETDEKKLEMRAKEARMQKKPE